MKHQISLVGRQLLPVYLGIKEMNPDKVHFIVSNESQASIDILKPLLASMSYSEYTCDAYDFYSIKEICENIVAKLDPGDDIIFNLTGGTKIMVLAAQAVIHEKKLKGFYINQDDTLLILPTYERIVIKTKLSITEFFKLNGHLKFSFKKTSDFSDKDYKTAMSIYHFAKNDYRYKQIISQISRQFKSDKIQIPKTGSIPIGKKLNLRWDDKSLVISNEKRIIYEFESSIITELFFNSVWWELVVSKAIEQWSKIHEHHIQFELSFKSDVKTSKNEIDVLINLGRKLIFIECKSGRIRQEDINKIKIIKDTYGGVISKSILVCLEMPNPNIIEKCNELGIDIFYSLDEVRKEVNPPHKLVSKLDTLEKKISI